MVSSRIGISLAAGLALLVTPALLLTPAPGWSQIDEVIVTTRKREESLQDVPIAISAISAEEIERRSIKSASDITKNLTSVEFDEGANQGDTRITMRGLSPSRGRQNVAVLVDGIDVSTEAINSSGGGVLLNTRLVDVERIEVVKGPQMALYGRSAFAGAIQYVTKDPSDVFEAVFGGNANAEDQYSGTLSLSGPVFGDKLGLRFNAAVWDEEGFYENALTGDTLGDDEGFGLALTARSQVTDFLTLKFRAEYQDQEAGPSPTAFLKFNAEKMLPAASLQPSTFNGQTYPAIFRCFQQLSAVTHNALLDARNARLYQPGFTPGGPVPVGFDPSQPAPNVLYSSPHCETAVSSFLGAPGDFRRSDIVLAPNPFTGADFQGVDRELIRLSLVADWEVAKGTLTSRTGYVHEEVLEQADNGKFGFPVDPASISPLTGAPFLDGNPNAFISDTDKLTRQFSQELMYRTSFDGPAQVTLGGLYWEEDVGNQSDSLTIQASGSHCAWASGAGIQFIDGAWRPNATFEELFALEAGTGCYGYTERPAAPLVRGGFNFTSGEPYNGINQWKESSPADRNTEHRSVFGMLELEMTPDWKLTFEGRYSSENVEAVGPLFLDPEASGGPGSWNPCGFFFRPCTDEWLFGPTGPFFSLANFMAQYDSWHPETLVDDDFPGGPTLRDVIPAACRNDPTVVARLADFDAGRGDPFDLFNPYCISSIERDDEWFSPKVTLDWSVNDDIKAYFSWSKAEKPGGFSTLGIGSSGLNRELLEYEPEKLQVWEVGAKTQWLDGTLVVNGATFFQDFSEKQTLVSVLNEAGDRLVNRLENVCCAEVWGLELDTTWAPITDFLGGNWQVSAAYTWLDAEYVGASVPNNSFTFISAVGNCEPTLEGPPGDEVVICNVSLDGKQLEDAPRGKFAGRLAYKRPLANGLDVLAELDFQWIDKRYIEPTNESWVESDTNTDLRLGLQAERWEVTGYITNLFDDDTITSVMGGPSLSCCFILGSGIDISGREPPAANPANNEPGKTVIVELPQFRAAFAPDPRVVGVNFRYRFGGL